MSSSTSTGAASAPAPSGCSSTGRMPPFPGHGLSAGARLRIGRPIVTAAGPRRASRSGTRVFVPGARCFGEVRGLFGGAAARLVVPGARVTPIDDALGEQGVLLALAATAYHAIAAPGCGAARPDRRPWRARPAAGAARGGAGRRAGGVGAQPRAAPTAPPATRCSIPPPTSAATTAASATSAAIPRILDTLIARLAPGGEIVLAGFYSERAVVSPFRRPSCARRASASPRNGSEPDLLATQQI